MAALIVAVSLNVFAVACTSDNTNMATNTNANMTKPATPAPTMAATNANMAATNANMKAMNSNMKATNANKAATNANAKASPTKKP
jgi:hypothetical protein